MVRSALAVAFVCGAAVAAHADADLCGPGAQHRGAPLDLDAKTADVRAVLQRFADTARVNLVLADDVTGKVTLRLRRVAWDEAACSIAAVEHLAITIRGNVMSVAKRGPR